MDKRVVILLDDDVLLRQRLKVLLEAEGYRVVDADNSKNVLQLIEKYTASLLITDLYMPDHNGAEAILKIRDQSGIPIIAITGYKNMLSVVKSMVNAYLLKPIKDEEFIKTVQTVMQELPVAQ